MSNTSFLWDFLIRLCVALVLVVVNSIIIHFIALKMKMEDESLDNPTSVAVIISILLIFVSYMPKLKIPFFVLTNSLVPIALIKGFYQINWAKSLKMWLLWIFAMLLIASVSSLVVIFFI